MNDGADRLGKTLQRKLARRFDHRVARGGDIVGEHRLTPPPRPEIGNLYVDAAVAVAELSEHGERRADTRRDRGDPLLALLVGTDQEGRLDVCRNPIGEHRCGVKRYIRNGVERRQRFIAMQVRIDGHQPVEGRRNEAREALR